MRIRDWSSDVCSSDLLIFDEQCFAVHGHFAGEDGHRFAALVEMANRPDIDAIWFARGGYGACRIAQEAVAAVTGAARGKAFLGYSDQGNLLACLDRKSTRLNSSH